MRFIFYIDNCKVILWVKYIVNIIYKIIICLVYVWVVCWKGVVFIVVFIYGYLVWGGFIKVECLVLGLVLCVIEWSFIYVICVKGNFLFFCNFLECMSFFKIYLDLIVL